MTIRELHHAIDGYMEAHGMEKSPDYDELLDMIDNSQPSFSIVGRPGAVSS